MNRIADISLRQAAIAAGFGLLIMVIFLLPTAAIQSQIVPEDAATTADNIMANEGLFRIGICSYIIVVVIDVVVAWALFVFLKPVNKSLSLLAGWFRLAYAIIFGVALSDFFDVLELLSGADYLKVFGTDQLHAQVMSSLNAFSDGWDIGYVFFGLHLALVGYLVYRSGYIPKILGVLVIVAGLGYLVDIFGTFLFPNYDVPIAMFTFIGEILFALWLAVKGIKGIDVQRTQ